MVRVARFELTASWTRTMRATNCATPGFTVLLYERTGPMSRTFYRAHRIFHAAQRGIFFRCAHRNDTGAGKGAVKLPDYNYTTVAEEYQGKRLRSYRAGNQNDGGEKEKFSRRELLRWGRVLLCAALLLCMVLTKVNLPDRFEELRAVVAVKMSQSMDYREVFSALGRAASGEATIRESLNDVYIEVFHPSEGQAAQTTATGTLSDMSQQATVNALLAFSQGQEGGTPHAGNVLHTLVAESAPPEETENAETPKADDAEGTQQAFGISCTTPAVGWLSSAFGVREHPIEGEKKMHRGVDIAAPEGSSIVAFADGTVIAVGESASLGEYIIVEHAEQLTTTYAHCSKLIAREGAQVKRGEKIAEVGHTGLATGPHLHFALQRNGDYLNPIPYVTLEQTP